MIKLLLILTLTLFISCKESNETNNNSNNNEKNTGSLSDLMRSGTPFDVKSPVSVCIKSAEDVCDSHANHDP